MCRVRDNFSESAAKYSALRMQARAANERPEKIRACESWVEAQQFECNGGDPKKKGGERKQEQQVSNLIVLKHGFQGIGLEDSASRGLGGGPHPKKASTW